jgi:hypothetical protein
VRLSVAHLVIEGVEPDAVATTEFVIPDNSTVVGVEISRQPILPLMDQCVDLRLQVSIVTDLGPSA